MELRTFRDTDVKTSLLGLGCMRFLKTGNGEEIDYEPSEKVIDYAYKNGVNYFDSAYVYNVGDSERVMGKALSKYPRKSYLIATKIPWMKCGSRQSMLEAFDEQLERCRTDYIDFYLCHNVNTHSYDAFTQEHVIPVLKELKEQGRIRYMGFSSHGTPDMLLDFVQRADWDFVQLQLNYIDWTYQDAKRQYEILTERGIPVMVMEPLRGGRLANLPSESMKNRLLNYSPDASCASWALRFAASLPNVQVVLSGMNDIEQVRDNVKTMSGFKALSSEEQEILDATAREFLSLTQVPCTQCGYCAPHCPQEIDIPMLINMYNEYQISRKPLQLVPIARVPEDKRPDKCVACGACSNNCPQGIDIPRVLSALSDELRDNPPPAPRS